MVRSVVVMRREQECDSLNSENDMCRIALQPSLQFIKNPGCDFQAHTVVWAAKDWMDSEDRAHLNLTSQAGDAACFLNPLRQMIPTGFASILERRRSAIEQATGVNDVPLGKRDSSGREIET